ncbi:MAG TPA: glycoside hydrolase family 3 N-terminal domain-containing protein [Gemmatimonadaceae bacterium]|nr:glycoside hydrolase family 3 N-terminal domain-containing protein [Gemmatimonadaceae bacterium]
MVAGSHGSIRRLFGVAAAVLATACTTPTGRSGTIERPSPRGESDAWADSVIARLSLRQKVAQMVWPFMLGDYAPATAPAWRELERLVSEEEVGGFIVSVGSPLDIATKVNALQEQSRVPLLFSADFETGAGFRVRGGYFVPNAIDLGGATVFPLQMALGASRDSALAYDVGRVTAVEGRALGVHVSFGPVLDVNNNPANPVIGARSFSEDPRVAARLGAALVRGVQEHGMLATAKHFPGHGDTETNSHLSLSTVTASRARLDSVELVPFRAAIAAGVGAIMTYHGILPALDDSGVPATLSSRVLTGLLRDSLSYDGVVITDAMDMIGVLRQFGASEAARRAVAAGADVLLMPTDVSGTIDAVVAGVAEGRYDEARIDASVRRLLELKRSFGLHRSRLVSLDSVRTTVGDTAHVAIAHRVAERGIVLVKDSLRSVPLPTSRATRLLSITYARRSDLGAGVGFNAEIRRGFDSVRTEFVSADDVVPNFERLLRLADSADVTIVSSYVNISSTTATAGAPRAFLDFVMQLQARRTRNVLVSFGTPYLLQQAPSAAAYMIAWGPSQASQLAAARALLGTAAITGVLPISLPPYALLGSGEQREVRRRGSQ